MTPAVQVPSQGDYVLRGGRLPASVMEGADAPGTDGCVRTDVLVRGGRIAAIGPGVAPGLPAVDLDGGLLWPTCVELHTHLDKGHTLNRARNPDGTLLGAVTAVREDRLAHWSAGDVERRFEFSLRCAWAHGTSAIRTHIDSYHPQAPISWPVFARLRERWAGRVELQGVSLALLDAYDGEEGAALADLVAESGGILGGVTRIQGAAENQSADRIAAGLDRVFRLAAERGLDVDLHVDEGSDLEPDTLRMVAQAVLRNDFRGKVVCGHCCSLALRTDADATETIALVKAAGLAIVTLPMVNLHLQGRRPGATPRWRGVTLVRELAAAGVPVAASSDNCRDPLYSFGDFDAVEVFASTLKICHLDHEGLDWLPLVTRTPAEVMGLPGAGRLAVGMDADLIAFRARSASELLARPQSDRVVLRGGRAIDSTLPDFRELD